MGRYLAEMVDLNEVNVEFVAKPAGRLQLVFTFHDPAHLLQKVRDFLQILRTKKTCWVDVERC